MRLLQRLCMLGLFMIVVSGCSAGGNSPSTESIIAKTLDGESSLSYYAEAELIMEIENVEEMTFHTKEWNNANGDMRFEISYDGTDDQTIILIDDEKILMYTENTDVAMVFDRDDITELEFPKKPLKDSMTQLLEEIQDTHTFTLEKETEVINRKAYHIKAVEKEEKVSEHEFWIDKENGFVLKVITTAEDGKTEINYTLVDFDADIAADKFTLDLPDDVHVVDLNELDE